MDEPSSTDGPRALRQRAIDEGVIADGEAARALLPAYRTDVERHARRLALARHPAIRAFHRWRLDRARRRLAVAISDAETARVVSAATRGY